MKIVIVTDKPGTAIDRLAQMTKRACPQHDIKIIPVHPKRPSALQVMQFETESKDADVIDYRYWKSAEMIIERIGDHNKPRMLTHYNPYDINRDPWDKYKINIVVNNYQMSVMKHRSRKIPLPVDLLFWQFVEEKKYLDNQNVIMVANRIEGKKGIIEIAQATDELGIPMILVGSPSDNNYLNEVMKHKNVTYKSQISDDELRALYHLSALHICNSIDNFESGTMPILEAMSCGIPVLSRPVGHVPDLFSGKNLYIHDGPPDDIPAIKEQIKTIMEDPASRSETRKLAWDTIKYRNVELYGRSYSRIYNELANGDKPLVSVIIPTADRPATLARSITSVLLSKYKNIEIIIVDDGITEAGKAVYQEIRRTMPQITLKYYKTTLYDDSGVKTYGLARARNKGIMEAEGECIMLLDERMSIQEDAIDIMLERLENKSDLWVWGVKDDVKKGFVENFSMIKRKTLLRLNGFSEQITQYGGMTQEIRHRAEGNGVAMKMVEDARATSTIKSSGKTYKKMDIVKSKTQCYKLNE